MYGDNWGRGSEIRGAEILAVDVGLDDDPSSLI